MMTQAFYTGVSGIKTSQYGIDVVADNLANISTVGFRGSEAGFSSLFENALVTSSSNSLDSTIGVGSTINSTSMMQGVGTIQLSDKSTDLAIYGDGWFGVQGFNDTVYTRDGNFSFDANSDLVTSDGFHVLGTMGGNIQGDVLSAILSEVPLGDVAAQEKLQFPQNLTYPTEPSSTAQFIGNIGFEDEVRTIGAGVVDPDGNKNHLKLTLTKTDVQTPPGSQWDVVATTESLDGETIYDTQVGTAFFNADGGLQSTTLTSINNNGAQVAIDLGSGYDGVTAIANVAITASTLSDGIQGGDLQGYDINRYGEVVATFTNGMQSSVGQIAVYHFQNDQGLDRISGSKFSESANSGEPIFFKDANGENIIGTEIVNYNLEGSNVTMSHGLTELIILQRTFDANSKSITTADQMMQKALNMDA